MVSAQGQELEGSSGTEGFEHSGSHPSQSVPV